MRSTITLNGIESSEIEGLLIQSLPPISKPLMRTQIEEIDGRDGDIVTNLGFSAYTKEFTIGLYGNFDIDEIISYFNSEGTVTFSNEPDKYYNYQIIDQIDFERLIRYRTATVSMHVQPFKYSATEGADILSASDNFATLDQSLNTDSSFYTYASNVQDDVTATRNGTANNGKFFAVFTIPVVQGITYHFSGDVTTKVTMYAYTDRLRGTSAGIAGKAFTGDFTYTATFTGTMILGFYASVTTQIFIRNFFVTNEAGATVSGEGTLITLEGTSESPFVKFDLKGDTTQQTYTGKNLLNVASSYTVSHSDIFKTVSISAMSGVNYRVSCSGITTNGTGTCRIGFNDAGGNNVGTVWLSNTNKSANVTLTGNAVSVYIYSDTNYSASQSATTTYTDLMVAEASTSTDYEPYTGGVASPNPSYPQEVKTVTGEQTITISDGQGQSQSYSVNLGKNLCDGISQGYWLTSAATGAGQSEGDSGLIIPVAQNTNYTISTTASQARYRIAVSDQTYQGSQFTCYNGVNKDGTSDTITISTDSHKYLIVNATDLTKIQIEKGSTATTYAPYFTPIELCKIGTYQDYIYKSGDDWYVHKETDKVKFTGAETETWSSETAATGYVRFNISSGETLADSNGYCNELINRGSQSHGAYEYVWIQSNTNAFHIQVLNTRANDLASFRTWLGANHATVYYALATATDTKITDSTLIGQLEALMTEAHAYDGTTVLASSADDLPHIMSVAVGASIDGTITNSGNTTARPKLTLFGSGTIGIYLNGNQIFNVNLGTEGHITIDTNAMEAYQDTTDNLMNRLVTGDYSSFVLQAGDNQISFSGNATMCVVENYSRWI